jgi:hypothetical protein
MYRGLAGGHPREFDEEQITVDDWLDGWGGGPTTADALYVANSTCAGAWPRVRAGS